MREEDKKQFKFFLIGYTIIEFLFILVTIIYWNLSVSGSYESLMNFEYLQSIIVILPIIFGVLAPFLFLIYLKLKKEKKK